jgi:serine/threonine-protein kinase
MKNPTERGTLATARRNTVSILFFVVGVLSASGFAQTSDAVANTRANASSAYFPTGAIWTRDISNAPLDPESARMIDWLAKAGGWGTGVIRVDFNLRVLRADSTTPSVPFRPGPGWMDADSDRLSRFPLPIGGGIEGQSGYRCNTEEEDCHLIVVDDPHRKLYEAFHANYANGVLLADFVAVWDLKRVYPPSGRGDQCTSADAAGFPIAPLLFNADELKAGNIDHAIRFILPNQRMRAGTFVHPATHAGAPSGPPAAPPYGARFRLKSSFDISQLKPAAQVVARAMQRYGMLLADGGNIALTAQSDLDTATKYIEVNFETRDLSALKVTDFEVVDGGKRIPLTYDCFRTH